jgi:hypothetical protein
MPVEDRDFSQGKRPTTVYAIIVDQSANLITSGNPLPISGLVGVSGLVSVSFTTQEVRIDLATADIQIGAVELKDGARDIRAAIGSAATAGAGGLQVMGLDNSGDLRAVPVLRNATAMGSFALPIGGRDTSGKLRMLKTDTSGNLSVEENPAVNYEGGPVVIGTTAVEITFSGTTRSIQIQSDYDNTGKLWIGKSNIGNSGSNAVSRLEAGDAIQLKLNDSTNSLYAISDITSQKIYKVALT